MDEINVAQAGWVLYREDSDTHREIYFKTFTPDERGFPEIISTSNVQVARLFSSAGEAYKFAEKHVELQWWRVGRR